MNHATGYVVNFHHSSLTAASTIESKHKCEKTFADLGIHVKGDAANKHPFCSVYWKEDCEAQHQLQTNHSGVGVHYQILCERYIQTIFNWSTVMMRRTLEEASQYTETNTDANVTDFSWLTITNNVHFEF